MKKLQDDPSYDPSDWCAATEKAQIWGDEIPMSKFFQRSDLPTLHGNEPILADDMPLAHSDPRIASYFDRQFVEELM